MDEHFVAGTVEQRSAAAEAGERRAYVGQVDQRGDGHREVDELDRQRQQLEHHGDAEDGAPGRLVELVGSQVGLGRVEQRVGEGEDLDHEQHEEDDQLRIALEVEDVHGGAILTVEKYE